MTIFDFFDEMLEHIHEFPHKARHYNRTILANIKPYQKAYKKSLKQIIKENFSKEKNSNKFAKSDKKLKKILNKKIQSTETMLNIINGVLNDFNYKFNEHQIDLELNTPTLPNIPTIIKTSDAGGVYCICRKGSLGDMILCDSVRCKIKWFHFKCVGISSCPKGSWYCPDCKKDWRITRLTNDL